MNDLIDKMQKKKEWLEKFKTKKYKGEIFKKVEEIDGRKIYTTRIFSDFYKFGVSKHKKKTYFITLNELFSKEKKSILNLFQLQDDDKFLGMFFGYKKFEKNLVVKDFEKKKEFTIAKPYYVEFRFKRGSVFLFLRGIHALLKVEGQNRSYYIAFLERMKTLEKEVYEFYNKKLPEGGKIIKWISKRQK